MNSHTWLQLLYKIPRHPTSLRVSIWRKLKRLGAILLHDSVWILPSTPRTLEQFQWLVVEIGELGGEATLWESTLLLGGKEEHIIQEFLKEVDSAYHDILTELDNPQADLVSLSKRYQQIKIQDYFHSEVGKKVQEALKEARERGK